MLERCRESEELSDVTSVAARRHREVQPKTVRKPIAGTQ